MLLGSCTVSHLIGLERRTKKMSKVTLEKKCKI